jgi:ribonucleases P/MRP protein subunit RPP40
MDKVTKEVDEGKSVDIYYLDFAKAFDKVPRQRLVKKLNAKGVHIKTVRWIKNWLSERTQTVFIHREHSSPCPVESGVPQGTVLGPTLFTIFIDDLDLEVIREMLNVWMNKFADDTKGGKVIVCLQDKENLQRASDLLCNWAKKWGMSFNVQKCKIMHVGKNNPCYEYHEMSKVGNH